MSNQLQLLVAAQDGTDAVPDAAFFRLNKMALAVESDMPENQFVALGIQIGRMHRASQFYIGDWLIAAKSRHPRCYEMASEIFGLEVKTLQKAFYVASNVPVSRRRDHLSFDHHESVAKLEDPDQEKWLAVAEKEHLAGKELRASVLRGEVVRFSTTSVPVPRDAGQSGPLVAIANLNQAFANAKREHGEDIAKWPSAMVSQWDRHLQPVGAFIAEVRKAAR